MRTRPIFGPIFWLLRSKARAGLSATLRGQPGLALQSQKIGGCPHQTQPIESKSHPHSIAYFTLLLVGKSGPPQYPFTPITPILCFASFHLCFSQ